MLTRILLVLSVFTVNPAQACGPWSRADSLGQPASKSPVKAPELWEVALNTETSVGKRIYAIEELRHSWFNSTRAEAAKNLNLSGIVPLAERSKNSEMLQATSKLATTYLNDAVIGLRSPYMSTAKREKLHTIIKHAGEISDQLYIVAFKNSKSKKTISPENLTRLASALGSTLVKFLKYDWPIDEIRLHTASVIYHAHQAETSTLKLTKLHLGILHAMFYEASHSNRPEFLAAFYSAHKACETQLAFRIKNEGGKQADMRSLIAELDGEAGDLIMKKINDDAQLPHILHDITKHFQIPRHQSEVPGQPGPIDRIGLLARLVLLNDSFPSGSVNTYLKDFRRTLTSQKINTSEITETMESIWNFAIALEFEVQLQKLAAEKKIAEEKEADPETIEELRRESQEYELDFEFPDNPGETD